MLRIDHRIGIPANCHTTLGAIFGYECGLFIVPTKIYVQVIVWGQMPQLRLMITIAPMVIMITTISIALLSLYRARKLHLKHDIPFDPMNVLHIVAACSSGNVQTIQFPDYSEDIGVFCKYVGVRFPEGRAGKDDVQSFHFSH